jgi:hypothetical protein
MKSINIAQWLGAIALSCVVAGAAGAQDARDVHKAQEKIQRTDEKTQQKVARAEEKARDKDLKTEQKVRKDEMKDERRDDRTVHHAVAVVHRSSRSRSTGVCSDGVVTTMRARSGACLRHGGVKEWYHR